MGFSGAMSENPTVRFLKFFGLKSNLFLYNVAFLNVKTLGGFSSRLFCEFDCHQRHTTILQSVFMQTWKPKTKQVFDVFCYETQIFCHKIAFFIAVTPSASIQASVWWISASSDYCDEIPKRFNADLKNPTKNLFWYSSWPKTNFSALQLLF